jgi:hypothetical protein
VNEYENWKNVEFPEGYKCGDHELIRYKHKAAVQCEYGFAFTLQKQVAAFYLSGSGIDDKAVLHTIQNEDRQQLVIAACTYHKLVWSKKQWQR